MPTEHVNVMLKFDYLIDARTYLKLYMVYLVNI